MVEVVVVVGEDIVVCVGGGEYVVGVVVVSDCCFCVGVYCCGLVVEDVEFLGLGVVGGVGY